MLLRYCLSASNLDIGEREAELIEEDTNAKAGNRSRY